MKKTFILTIMALLMAVGANAQVKKTWDFLGAGLSEETVANLDADEANWEKEGTKDGKTTGWKEAKKHTGVFMANDEVIPELLGLELVNSGLGSNNNVIIRPDRFRVNRNNMKLKLPKLVNGQTITVNIQSANGTAIDRGMKASYDYMKRIEGPSDDLYPGADGIITNKWEVQTTETDSVDIEFTFITGGLDIRLIMIDNGDEAKPANITYLYNGDDDQVLNYLKANELYSVNAINVTSETVTADALRENEITIVAASVPADNAAVVAVKEAMPWTPVLNLNPTIYSAWGYGEAAEPSAPFIVVKNKGNALFKNVEIGEEGGVAAYVVADDMLMGVTLGDYFEGDPILGVALSDDGEANNDVITIHTHNVSHNGYIFLAYNSQALLESALPVIDNAIATLQNSKADITPATAPTLSKEYKDNKTNVTINLPSLPKAQAFYTIDGSEPTTESTKYEGTFTVDQVCTVKAVAIAEGYTLSNAAELAVEIYTQPEAPSISYVQEEGKTIITLINNDEVKDTTLVVWYNFEGTTDTIKSSKYVEPFTIEMPQTVTAFAVINGLVWSEVTEQRVLVKNPRVVIDVAAHFKAAAWDGISNGNKLFGNASSMYDTDADPIGKDTDPETGDEIDIYPEREYQIKDEPGDDPQWTVMTKGQCIIWQNNDLKTDKIGTNEGGYYPSVAEDIDPLFPATKNDIQFADIFGGEHANAAIQSKNKYQAPLDIVVFANMQGGPIVAQVSADGKTWETVGEEIAKTGLSRMWKKYTRCYNGTGEVYVRVAQETGSAAAKIFDIFVANQGERSQELLDQLNEEYVTGIKNVEQPTAKAAAGIYNLSGARQNSLKPGLNIVVEADGTVKKVVVK